MSARAAGTAGTRTLDVNLKHRKIKCFLAFLAIPCIFFKASDATTLLATFSSNVVGPSVVSPSASVNSYSDGNRDRNFRTGISQNSNVLEANAVSNRVGAGSQSSFDFRDQSDFADQSAHNSSWSGAFPLVGLAAAAALALSRKSTTNGTKSSSKISARAAVHSTRQVPEGTPSDLKLAMRTRPRRNRRSAALRSAFSETKLSVENLVMPIFVTEGNGKNEISSMPGVYRVGIESEFLKLADECVAAGLRTFVLFPKTPEHLKTPLGEECYNPKGLAQRAIRLLKTRHPGVTVCTDVALDPYSSMGHDGIVRSDGVVLNDATVKMLCKQAISQAEAGADIISPSDMMDGRVGAIRDALDAAGFTNVGIMSYTAKYASALYGPFRDALDSAPASAGTDYKIPVDKKEYQQDPANFREALREADLDEHEGADIMMVKPAAAYLDVIRGLKERSTVPIAAYHVSGEYAMLKAVSQKGWLKKNFIKKIFGLDERSAAMEVLLSIKRAGADLILTYYALDAAKWLKEDQQQN